MNAVAVERLGPGDLDAARAVNRLFGEVFDDESSYGSGPGDDYLRRLLGNEAFIMLAARRDGRIVGALAAYELVKFERERSELYIYDLGVAMDHRRRGVATRLIRELKRIARERNAWMIYVQADLGDALAIALYEGFGEREDVLHFDILPA